MGGVTRFSQLVMAVLQFELTVVAFDGKDFLEESFESLALSSLRIGLLLEKASVAAKLEVR